MKTVFLNIHLTGYNLPLQLNKHQWCWLILSKSSSSTSAKVFGCLDVETSIVFIFGPPSHSGSMGMGRGGRPQGCNPVPTLKASTKTHLPQGEYSAAPRWKYVHPLESCLAWSCSFCPRCIQKPEHRIPCLQAHPIPRR